jgi:nicotinate-nucleotide adenylyltransferase
MEQLGLDRVTLIPSGVPPFKQSAADLASTATPANRLAMCRLAVEGIVNFEVSDIEIHDGGPSFTIDTARALKKTGWETVRWLIGSDALLKLHDWHEATNLLAEVQFIVMVRAEWPIDWDALPPKIRQLRPNVVTVPQIQISATEIRRRVAAGLDISFLTPPAVCDFIRIHNLYRVGKDHG